MHKCFYLLVFIFSYVSAEEVSVKAKILSHSQTVTGQRVYVEYEHLNISSGWALAYGQLLTESKGQLDWASVPNCEMELDKGLWAILQKLGDSWEFVEYDACSTEPPYWYIEIDKNTWPCGIFKGLKLGDELTLEQKCLSKNGLKIAH